MMAQSLKEFLLSLDASRGENFVLGLMEDLAAVDITEVCHLAYVTYDDLNWKSVGKAQPSVGRMGHLRLALAKLKPTAPEVQAWGTGACGFCDAF